MPKDEYKPVPVVAAKAIAEQYDKSIVIIAAWDPIHGLLHTTTYGKSIEEKNWAATGGEIVATALGTDISLRTTFEDFRKDTK